MKGKELQFGQCKIIVHRPDLNVADKARIEKDVRTRLESVMRSYMYRKGKAGDAPGIIAK